MYGQLYFVELSKIERGKPKKGLIKTAVPAVIIRSNIKTYILKLCQIWNN